MFRRPRIIFAAVVLTLLSATAACGGEESDSAAQSGNKSVTVATLPILYQAPLYLGIKKGFFKEEGLDVNPKVYQGFQPMIAAANNDDVQFGFTSVAPMLVASSAGVPIKILTAGNRIGHDDTVSATDALIVPKGSAYSSLKDLSGKTVGVSNLKGVQHLAVMAAIDNAGGDSSKTTFVGVPFADVQPALETKRTAVATLTEPYLSSALAASMKSISYYLAKGMPDLPLTGYFATGNYVQKNPKIVESFVKGMTKSTEYAVAHPDEVRAILADYTQIPADVAAKVVLPEYDSSITSEDITATSDLLVKYKFAPKAVDAKAVLE